MRPRQLGREVPKLCYCSVETVSGSQHLSIIHLYGLDSALKRGRTREGREAASRRITQIDPRVSTFERLIAIKAGAVSHPVQAELGIPETLEQARSGTRPSIINRAKMIFGVDEM